MAQTPNPMQGFNDWLVYQQSMMEKMTAVMTEATARTMPGAGMGQQANALTDAWTEQTQRATDALAKMSQTWSSALGGNAASAPAWPAMPNLLDPAMGDKVKAMFKQFGVVLPDAGAMPSVPDALLESLTKAPAFAHLWDLDQKLVGLMASWAQLHTANLAYRTLVAKTWTDAQQAAFQKAGQAMMAAPTTPDWRDNTDAWLADLTAALETLMKSSDYAQARKQLHDTGAQVRDQLRTLGTQMTEWFQLAPRDEVDDLVKTVADMRKQLRSLSAGAGAPASNAAPAEAATKPARGRKR
jgi:hypothetical protein